MMKNKAIIVYFSQTGQTKVAAEKIQELTQADIFRIQAKEPYDIHRVMQWSDRVDFEGKTAAFPEIKDPIPNWKDYSLVYLGFPIWFWGAPTRIMATLFKTYDFTGKQVAPFYTSYSTDADQAMGNLREMSSHQIDFLPGYRYEGNDNSLQLWVNQVRRIAL